MSRCASVLTILALSVGLLFLVEATTGQGRSSAVGQDKAGAEGAKGAAGKQVDILTADRVKLSGKYFASEKEKAPCAILLHALGETCSNKEWTNLAKKLNSKGYAVLMFDFRGHGDSTTVMPGTVGERGFWDEAVNVQYVQGYSAKKPRPTEIKYEQFKPQYYTVLVNDIAAAKSFLDDQGDCNSFNLTLIGANDAAILGSVWLNSEFRRYRLVPAVPGQIQDLDRQNPEGLAIKAAIWLSMGKTVGNAKSATLPVAQILDWPVRSWKTPLILAYGEGDSKGKDLVTLYNRLVPAKIKKEYPHTDVWKIAKAEQMAGKDLLLDGLETTGKILKYLEDVPDARAAAKARKAQDDLYYWAFLDQPGGGQPVLARKKGSDRMEFAAYSNFFK